MDDVHIRVKSLNSVPQFSSHFMPLVLTLLCVILDFPLNYNWIWIKCYQFCIRKHCCIATVRIVCSVLIISHMIFSLFQLPASSTSMSTLCAQPYLHLRVNLTMQYVKTSNKIEWYEKMGKCIQTHTYISDARVLCHLHLKRKAHSMSGFGYWIKNMFV